MADAIADFAGLEQGTETVDQQVPETEVSTEVQPDSGAPEADTGTGTTEQADGRKGPQALRDTVKALSEQSPEHAGQLKEMANSYFREKAYKQAFETPQLAADAKSLIDTVGGIEGISKMQERDQTYTQQDDFLRDGNPDVLKDFAEDFPDGFASLAPHYLSMLSQKNPEAFNNAVVPYAVGMLDNAGFADFLGNLQRETDPARQKQMVENLARWYQGAQNGAKELKTAPKNGNGGAKPDDGRAALQAEREQIFQEGVASKVNNAVSGPMDTAVNQYAKQYGWNDDQKAHYRQVLSDAVVRQMNDDKNYKQQVDLRRKNPSRSHDSVAQYISSEFSRRLTDVALETAKKIYGAPKGGRPATTGIAKPGGPQTAAGGGPLLVSQQPADSDIDWSKDPNQIKFITNRAHLKNGKFVTWK